MGIFVQDNFCPQDYNIQWKPNRAKNPDCLLGVTLKPVPTGTNLFADRGKDYWCAKKNFETLSPKMKIACRKRHDIVESDFVDY
jgi:hypothetical protein